MKKKILVALVLCLVLILSVSLVACGSKDTSTPDATPTTQGDGGNSGGSSGGGNSGGSGDDSGSGSGGGQGGQGGGSQTSTKTLPTETAILQTIGTTSFKLAVGNLSGTAVTTVATNGTYYYYANPGVTFGKIIGDYVYPYSKQSGKTNYTKMESRNTAPDLIHMVADLFLYAGQTISYETEEAVTFIGRAAKKYTVTYTDPGNNAHVQELIIDDTTGACLKHDSASSPTDGFVGGNQKTSFAAVEIAYGTDSAIATFLNQFISKIDVFEWETNYFTQAGLTSTAIVSPTSTWVLSESKWANNADRTSEEPDWSATYYYFTDDRDGTESTISNFVQSFYAAGANKNDSGVEKTYDQLCSYDVDDHSYYLSSYTNNGYLVMVSADHQTSLSPNRWIITVEIEKF